MKKKFVYASAMALLFASCSNEDGLVPQSGHGQPNSDVVNELRISLESETGAGTRTVAGEGSENSLHGAFIFVKADADGPDNNTPPVYDYKYIAVELGAGQTSTVVKHVQTGSKVYVLANNDIFNKAGADDLANFINTKVGAEDAEFQNQVFGVQKSYVSGLESTNGKFIMSGVATVPALSTTGATVLAVNVKRDLAKVSFKVKKQSTEANLRIKSVEEITVRRSADQIQPFAMKGTSPSSFELRFGFGDPKYKQDGLKGDVLAPDNNTPTADATDFSFLYTSKDLTTVGDEFVFKNFYVLPNAATTAEKGTIIVLKTKIEKSTTTDGTTTWAEVPGFKYYKARISSALTAYNTAQNASYNITATIKGEGDNTGAGPDGPDAENTDSDLNISVQVQDWSLVISNQTIQ